MPAKISAICFVHEINKTLTSEFTVKEITFEGDPTKIIYLKVKAFILSDKLIEMRINDFDTGM